MVQESLTKKLGKRILSEANDLKRTVESLAKEIGLQKNILQKRFNKQFHTPYKDAASFLTIPIIKTFYKHTVDHCLKNHFSSKLK